MRIGIGMANENVVPTTSRAIWIVEKYKRVEG